MNWNEIQRLHDAAAARLAETAESVDPEKWLVPRAEGKWTPAQVVEHLNRVYDVVLGELDGKPGMRIRTGFLMRTALRLTVVGRILRGGWFPEGAPAPYETRPGRGVENKDEAIRDFRARAAEFSSAVAKAHESGKKVRITHAYFGAASLERSTLLCARHIEHHGRQLLLLCGDRL